MVKTSGWTTPSSYSALGEPIKSPLFSGRPLILAKLHQNVILRQIITITTRNRKQTISLESGNPNPSKVHTHTPYRSLHD